MVVLEIDVGKTLANGTGRFICGQNTLARSTNLLSCLDQLLFEVAASVRVLSLHIIRN